MRHIASLIGKGLSFNDTSTLALSWNQSLPQPLDFAEVTRTHASIWRTHLNKNPSAQTNALAVIPSTNNFRLISAGSLLASPPQARNWLIKDFLPSRVVAALIAAGGTGKSYLAMHIAISVASGSSLFGKFIPIKPAKVVFISGEDDSTEIQRRLHAVMHGMPVQLKTSVNINLNFIDLADAFELFTQKPASGEVQITDVPAKLVQAIKQVAGDSVDLIIVDPVSRFRGGEENAASDTTRFVQSLQYLRDQLGATVLALHHVNKGAKTNGTSQNNARGSSAFIDGVRLVYELNALSDAETEKAYGRQIIMPSVLTLSSVKSNYGAPIAPIILCKRADGSLEQFGMQAGQHQDQSILQEIKLNPTSKTQFKKVYGSATGKFRLSEKALVLKLEDLEKQGLLTLPTRGIMQLTANGITLVEP
jgi:RecA-family ATPase